MQLAPQLTADVAPSAAAHRACLSCSPGRPGQVNSLSLLISSTLRTRLLLLKARTICGSPPGRRRMRPSLLRRFTSGSTAARSLPLTPSPTTAGLSALLHRQHRQGFSTAMDGGGSHEKTPPPAGGVAERILPHLLNLYGSRATARDFEIYAPDATFEDPLMRAHGVKQIKSSFYSLPKVFGESKIVEYTVQENPTGPGKAEILIDNKQHYKVFGKPVDLTTLIRLQVEDGKVVRHEDWWDKKPLKNRETVRFPLAGRLAEVTRRGAMLLTHALMGFGKDPPTSTTPSS